VTYVVTDAGGAQCTITGSILNAPNAGTCTVTVTKAADVPTPCLIGSDDRHDGARADHHPGEPTQSVPGALM